jgi:hypothetical protein
LITFGFTTSTMVSVDTAPMGAKAAAALKSGDLTEGPIASVPMPPIRRV